MLKIKQLLPLLVLLLLQSGAKAQFADPFKWKHSIKNDILEVEVSIPAHHYLYNKSTSLKLTDAAGKDIKEKDDKRVEKGERE